MEPFSFVSNIDYQQIVTTVFQKPAFIRLHGVSYPIHMFWRYGHTHNSRLPTGPVHHHIDPDGPQMFVYN